MGPHLRVGQRTREPAGPLHALTIFSHRSREGGPAIPIFGFFGGTRIRRRRLGDAVQRCPECGVDRRITRYKAENVLHLYWVPIRTLQDLGEIHACSACGREWPRDDSAPRRR